MKSNTARYYPLLTMIICIGLLCGHVISIVKPLTVFNLSLAVAVIFALLCHIQSKKLFYMVAGYFVIYGVWTVTVTPLWESYVGVAEIVKFLFGPILVVALLKLMLVSPRDMLRGFFAVSIIYLATMIALGCTEHFTGWHLTSSVLYEECTGAFHGASGLSYNPNDYCVLLTMAALYIFAYCNQFVDTKWRLFGYVAMAACVPLMIWDGCWTGLGIIAVALLFQAIRNTKKRKTKQVILAGASLAGCIAVTLNWQLVAPRLSIYVTSMMSLYDSYGLGFGIYGDSIYLSNLDNYDITHGLTNAHSYLMQIPLTSGLIVFLLYCIMIAWIMKRASAQGRGLFWIMPIFYLILLFSPSSSTYLWGHYVFFCATVCYAVYAGELLPELEKRKEK